MKPNKRFWFFVSLVICAVYIALRFWSLTASCLWFDEIFSVHAAEHSWQNLFGFVARDLIHPPLFYVLLKIWTSAGGESLFWLRFFPVFFSLLTIFPFILLCRELKLDFSLIALALTFFAVNGALIKYTQEVRMYSVLLFFALVSMWLFARFLNLGKNFFILTLVNILLVYTHYFGWFVVITEVFAILILQRIKIRQILLMLAVTAASFTPWIFAVGQAAKINSDVGQNIGWMSKPNLFAVFQFVFDLFEPIYFQQSSREKAETFLITLPLLLICVAVLVFYFFRLKKENDVEKRNFYLLLILTFLPIILAFFASWLLPFSIWGTRHLIIAFAPFAVLLAIAFSKIKFWQLKTAALSAVFLLFAAAFLLQSTRQTPVYIWCAWENLANNLYESTLHREESTNIRIYTFEDLVAYHFWFALRDSDRGFQVVKVNNVEGLTEDKAYFLPRGFDGIQVTNEFGIGSDKFFIAFRDKDWNLQKPPLRNLIEKGYRIGEPQIFEAQGLKAFLVEAEK